MSKIGFLVILLNLLLGCAASLAPNGMSWEEYHQAKHQFKVTYKAGDVAGCQELGYVRGSEYEDMALAKDAAIERAMLLGGDTIYFQKLWSDLRFYRLIDRRTIYYAEGTVYRCKS